MTRSDPTRPSVTSRVLAVLAAFDDAHRVLTLTEIAARAGLPLSTTHRLVAELAGWGALSRRASGGYVVGRRLWDLGLLAPLESGLRQTASPFLHDLFSATGATVHLAQRDGTQVLYVDRLSGRASVPVVSRVGSRLPLHATGVGKVLLAWAPAEVHEHVLAHLTRVTPYTVTRPDRLRSQLAQVRAQGYATTSEEMTLGACSIAVPVERVDEDGRVRVDVALGVVVTSLRRDRARLVAALGVAARGIARGLSGR